MKVTVKTLENKDVGEVTLSKSVFGLEPRADVLQRVVRWQLARRQAGTHKTQERSEVRGSTRKIVRQKGSGGARHGSKKPGLFIGGGATFGPRVRSHAHSLNKKFRLLGLKNALSAKQASKEVLIIESLEIKAVKTKEASALMAKLSFEKPLFVYTADDKAENFIKATMNLKNIDLLRVEGTNVYDILNHKELVMTKNAVKALEEKLA